MAALPESSGGGDMAGAGGGATPAAPAAPASIEAPAPAPVTTDPTTPTPAPGTDAPPADDKSSEAPVYPHQGLLDDIDSMGSEQAGIAPKDESESTEALSKDISSGDETKTTDADTTQSGDDTQAETTGDESGKEPPAGELPPVDTDWSKVSEADEAYLAKHVPKAHIQAVRKAYRDAQMSRSFLNPNSPVDVFVDNLNKKSAMRYGQIESEILKRNIETDPVAFLGKAFEATQDDTGNSEAYQRLLDGMIDTNKDYVLNRFKADGLSIGEAGDSTAADGLQQNGHVDLKDEEIDALTDGAAFQQFAETFPEEAEKLQGALASAKQLKADEAARKEAESTQQTEEQRKAETDAAEAATAKYVGEFSTVYDTTVMALVNAKLDKDYGLEITAEEQEKNPEMALLKGVKRHLLLNGPDGSGDFDNDLYKWGQDRPAFKEAAKAMVEFTRAGERENASAAAKELAPFADMFLDERMKMPQVAVIDKIIQLVAKAAKSGLETREERGPNSPLSPSSNGSGPGGGLLDEIDAMD